MAVTIKDVAALAGVSPSTVSGTCKNNPSISEETKERVRRAMAELGYEPNFQASNLAAQISRSIGIILPPSPKETYENSFYLETIRGISHYCNAHQYISTIVTGQNEEEILNAVRSMSRSGKVNGFIVLYSRVNDPVIDFLFSEGLLYILMLCSFSLCQTESVCISLPDFLCICFYAISCNFPCNMFDSILVMNYNISIRLR